MPSEGFALSFGMTGFILTVLDVTISVTWPYKNLLHANIMMGDPAPLEYCSPRKHSVEQTVDRLKNILQSKGVTLFAVIDHSGEAEKVGMEVPPTKLLIFGNPKAGTPLMRTAPRSAIDLPLKILIWEDAQGKVWLSYNSPEYLQKRHGLPQQLLQNIAVVETLARKRRNNPRIFSIDDGVARSTRKGNEAKI